MKIFMVGGAVRDKIMNRPHRDMDFAVEAGSYEEMKMGLLEMGCEIAIENPQYVSIRARHPEYGFSDFVLCRKDGNYRDGRHPEYVEVGDIYSDLQRRDFRMNAMAWDMEKDILIDPFNGVANIEIRMVECVVSPEVSFIADELRILRAIRFSVELDFYISGPIHYYLSNGLYDFRGVSDDRINEELHKAFKANTKSTLVFFNKYPLDICFNGKVWLMPTMKARK